MYGYGSVDVPPRPTIYDAVSDHDEDLAYEALIELDAHDDEIEEDAKFDTPNTKDDVYVNEAVAANDELIELDAHDAEIATVAFPAAGAQEAVPCTEPVNFPENDDVIPDAEYWVPNVKNDDV